MKAKFRPLSLAVAVCSVAICGFAAGEIRTHRTGVGKFTANSWGRAESTEGRFSVLMPAPFDDFTQESRTGDSRQGYFLQAKMPDGTYLSAVRAEYADAAESTKNCLHMRDGPAFGADLKSRRNFQLDGHTAVELTVNDGRAWMAMRVICLETEGLILSVTAPLDKIPEAQALAVKFFDSLKIKAN